MVEGIFQFIFEVVGEVLFDWILWSPSEQSWPTTLGHWFGKFAVISLMIAVGMTLGQMPEAWFAYSLFATCCIGLFVCWYFSRSE